MQIKPGRAPIRSNGNEHQITDGDAMKQVIPETQGDFERRRVLERPDGFYWEDRETSEVVGPFATLLAAVNDMEYVAEGQPEVGETVGEAEDEIGIADWIDPDTGEPAEESGPHRAES
jgi:hypothetical protein